MPKVTIVKAVKGKVGGGFSDEDIEQELALLVEGKWIAVPPSA